MARVVYGLHCWLYLWAAWVGKAASALSCTRLRASELGSEMRGGVPRVSALCRGTCCCVAGDATASAAGGSCSCRAPSNSGILGLCWWYTSQRSRRVFPGVSRGILAPEGRSIFPDASRMHRPLRTYSSASLQALTMWPTLPQNLHRRGRFFRAIGASWWALATLRLGVIAGMLHCMQIRVFSVEKLVGNSKECLTMF